MSGPDIQYFAASGTWHKPPGAVRVDCLIKAGDAGSAVSGSAGPFLTYPAGGGGQVHHGGTVEVHYGGPGNAVAGAGGGGGSSRPAQGELHVKSFLAEQIPDTMEIEVGCGGRGNPDGAGGYALIVTHLEQKP